MIALPSPSIRTFYTRTFFLLSSLPSMMTFVATFRMVPFPSDVLAVVAVVAYLALIAERFIRPGEFTKVQYDRRYVVLILLGMAVVTSDVFVLREDYILYLPILTGILYINVNAFLRSRVLRWAIVVFMASPLVPLFLEGRSRAATYIGVLVLFAFITWASNLLYHVNATVLDASERELEILRNVFRLSNALVQHDVRNEMQKMQILATARYRQDPVRFLDAFSDFTERIESILDSRPFETRALVRPRELLDRLSHLTADPNIRFEAHLDDKQAISANRNLLFSTLKNLLDNSIEAARSNGIRGHVVITQKPGEIILEDDCGGFRVESVREGRSQKSGDGHGVFLRTILDPTAEAIFGFRVDIVNTGKGTRVTMTCTEGG